MYHNVGASCFRRFLQSVMQVGAGFITLLTVKEKWVHIEILEKLESSRNSRIKLYNSPNFVKIIRRENANFGLALRKRRFCDAKEPLLPCKTYAFAM